MPFSWKLYCCRLVLASKPQIWNFDDVVSIGRLREKIAPKSVPREFPSFRCLMDCPRNTLDSVLIKPYLGIPEVPVFLLNQPIDLQNSLKFLLNGLLVKCLILLNGPLFGNATLNRNPGGQHTQEISRLTEVVIYCCVCYWQWLKRSSEVADRTQGTLSVHFQCHNCSRRRTCSNNSVV